MAKFTLQILFLDKSAMNQAINKGSCACKWVEDMNAFIREIENRDDVRVIVLAGTGEHFMAGGNVKSFAQMVKEMDAAERKRMFEERIHKMHIMFYTMARMPQPIVAAVRGGCAGVGLSFVLACDMAIASENAFFTMGYILAYKGVFFDPIIANTPENWLFGISQEGIGAVGMVLNFIVAFAVSKVTAEPPEHIQVMIEDIRVPKGAGSAVDH